MTSHACTIQLDELTPHRFRASTTVFPDLEGVGATADEASQALNAAIERHLRRELGEAAADAADRSC